MQEVFDIQHIFLVVVLTADCLGKESLIKDKIPAWLLFSQMRIAIEIVLVLTNALVKGTLMLNEIT
jgi:hypothetical protein